MSLGREEALVSTVIRCGEGKRRSGRHAAKKRAASEEAAEGLGHRGLGVADSRIRRPRSPGIHVVAQVTAADLPQSCHGSVLDGRVRILERRMAAGDISELDLARARAELANARTDALSLERARGQWRDLTGAGVTAEYWSEASGRWEQKR